MRLACPGASRPDALMSAFLHCEAVHLGWTEFATHCCGGSSRSDSLIGRAVAHNAQPGLAKLRRLGECKPTKENLWKHQIV